MNKMLFSSSDNVVVVPQFAFEEFREYHRQTPEIAMEAISDYLYKAKDIFVSRLNNLPFVNKFKDLNVSDAIRKKYEIRHVLKRVPMTALSKEQITIPERFKGNMTELILTLQEVSDEMSPDVHVLMDNCKLAIASFINEYSENGVLTIYGVKEAKEMEKKRADSLKRIAKFFPHTKSITKAEIGSVIKNKDEISRNIDEIYILSKSINNSGLDAFNKKSAEISDLVDTLIAQNAKSGIMTRNTEAKKDLIDVIHITAECVSFMGYLYANALHCYGFVYNMGEKVIEIGKKY